MQKKYILPVVGTNRCRELLRGEDPDMKKYFDYLDHLRDSGVTNMFGAAPYLQKKFPELGFDETCAREVLTAWMDSRSARQDGGGYDNG